MAKAKSGLCISISTVGSLLLGMSGCAPKLAPTQAVRIDLVLNELKNQINDIGQFEYTFPPEVGNVCGPSMIAIPGNATITLKTILNTTTTATGAGNIPVSYVVISPSLTASYTNVQTQNLTFDVNIDPGSLPPMLLIPTAAPATTPITATVLPDLKTAIRAFLEGAVNADHTRAPCLLPQTLKLESDFGVTQKVDGGIQINFIVAKFGADVAVSNDRSQGVTITMNLKGSELILKSPVAKVGGKPPPVSHEHLNFARPPTAE